MLWRSGFSCHSLVYSKKARPLRSAEKTSARRLKATPTGARPCVLAPQVTFLRSEEKTERGLEVLVGALCERRVATIDFLSKSRFRSPDGARLFLSSAPLGSLAVFLVAPSQSQLKILLRCLFCHAADVFPLRRCSRPAVGGRPGMGVRHMSPDSAGHPSRQQGVPVLVRAQWADGPDVTTAADVATTATDGLHPDGERRRGSNGRAGIYRRHPAELRDGRARRAGGGCAGSVHQ